MQIIVYQSAGGSTCTVTGVQQEDESDEAFVARMIDTAVPPDATGVHAVDAATYVGAPPPPVPPSPREWLERLSPTKQAAIAAAGMANAATYLWLMKAMGSASIDVTLPETVARVAAFVTAGVIDAADQAVLLAP